MNLETQTEENLNKEIQSLIIKTETTPIPTFSWYSGRDNYLTRTQNFKSP